MSMYCIDIPDTFVAKNKTITGIEKKHVLTDTREFYMLTGVNSGADRSGKRG